MRKFLDAIETALAAAKIDCNGIGVEAGATQLFALRMAGAGRTRHTERLQFLPDHGHPHRFLVEEIWIARESDGSPWSDNMGGVVVDCAGLRREAAVKKIVNAAAGHFPQWFEK